MKSEVEKCVICNGETPYTKDTPIDQRENYTSQGQLCGECAKKQD